jgi:hypothetical protein
VFLGNGDGTFQAPASYACYPGPLALADFNADGHPDLLVGGGDAGNGQANVYVLLNQGAGTFGPAIATLTGAVPNGVAAGDFNGDGKMDMAIVGALGPGCTVYRHQGNGDGTFVASPKSYPLGVGYCYGPMVSVDLNGDNKLDLAFSYTNPPGSEVALLGLGTGLFAGPDISNAIATPWGISTGGDFNGDGTVDLVTSLYQSSAVSVALGNGQGGFPNATSQPAGTQPLGTAVADFDGDGRLDVAVANFADGNAGILLGRGDGTLKAMTTYVTGALCRSVAVGDLNADGKIDLAVGYNGGVTILLQ